MIVIPVNVKDCARCGKDHQIDFAPFRHNPIECSGVIYTHWGYCPNVNEPVIMVIETTDDLKP